MKKIIIPIAIVLCLAGGGFAVWNVLESNVFSKDQFPQKTSINNVDCSGMTAEQAKETLIEEWNSRSFYFTSKGKTIGSADDLNFTYDIDDNLKKLKKANFFSAASNYFFNSDFDVTMDMTVKKVNKGFKQQLKQAEYLREDKITKTRDAYVDLSTADFEIVPEVYGNNTDYNALSDKIAELVAEDTFTLEYKTSDFYKQPDITADSEEIKEHRAFCKKYLTSKVTYVLGKEEVKIPPQELEKIYHIEVVETGKVKETGDSQDGEDGQDAQDEQATSQSSQETQVSGEEEDAKKPDTRVLVDEEAVRQYVENFAKDYNTLGMTRKFLSFSGKNIEVSGGDYGFALDVDGETQQLVKDLEANKEVKREPVWLMTGFADYSKEDDIGNTYVDISLTDQHLWYFKDGKKIVDCPVVTGNINAGYNTPAGTFSLSYKQRGATLKGNNADGSTYESPVSYWMPFYGNYGMHDAPWRGSFGGNIFRGNGSHGCVNMPIPAAKKLFENLADKGVPVIVHW